MSFSLRRKRNLLKVLNGCHKSMIVFHLFSPQSSINSTKLPSLYATQIPLNSTMTHPGMDRVEVGGDLS